MTNELGYELRKIQSARQDEIKREEDGKRLEVMSRLTRKLDEAVNDLIQELPARAKSVAANNGNNITKELVDGGYCSSNYLHEVKNADSMQRLRKFCIENGLILKARVNNYKGSSYDMCGDLNDYDYDSLGVEISW